MTTIYLRDHIKDYEFCESIFFKSAFSILIVYIFFGRNNAAIGVLVYLHTHFDVGDATQTFYFCWKFQFRKSTENTAIRYRRG